jgi:hypothetical protein
MRTLTDHEKRTIRLAGIGIGIYLALFGGYKVWTFLARQRAGYQQLLVKAQDLKHEITRYEGKIAITKKLMETYHMDPARLTRSTVVAEASAAIQKVAKEGGFQLSTLRETPARSSGRELASIQLEGSGPVLAAMGLFHRLETCGYPVVIESAQISLDPSRPGQTKLNLTILVLDFEQMNKAEVPHA